MSNLDSSPILESKPELPDDLQQTLPKPDSEIIVDDIVADLRDKIRKAEAAQSTTKTDDDDVPVNQCPKKFFHIKTMEQVCHPTYPLTKDNDLTVLRFSKKSVSRILEFLVFICISVIVLITIISGDLSAFENAVLVMVYLIFIKFSAICKKYLSD